MDQHQREHDRTLIAVIIFVLVVILWPWDSEASDEFKYRLNFLPVSSHHTDGTYNETHKGVGFSVKLPNNATYGVMHYANSYDRDGLLLSLSTEQKDCELCFGVGVGYGTAYHKDDKIPIAPFVTARYGYVQIVHVPTAVSALVFTFPLN